MSSLLFENSVVQKLSLVADECQNLLNQKNIKITAPDQPARDIAVVARKDIPRREGLNTNAGQAHLLHDLANIELQAMELGLRTLHEFPDAPKFFREKLAAVTLEEAHHLQLCLNGIHALGFEWGTWPILTNLWTATSAENSLIDRILIVHCYLEGSGLDSGELILQKLSGVTSRVARDIVKTIAHDEVGHVQFGLDWYKQLCQEHGLDAQNDFSSRLNRLAKQIPARTTFISEKARTAAGFSPNQIQTLRNFNKYQA